jgi:hypothetical protein
MTDNPKPDVWAKMIEAKQKEARVGALQEFEAVRAAAIAAITSYDKYDGELVEKLEALAVALGMREAKP